jgi:hypothetical protein
MDQAPGSLTSCAPWRVPGSQTQKAAPVGSASTAMRPAGAASHGSLTTLPPAATASRAAASTSATRTWVCQPAGGAGEASRGSGAIPATSRPRRRTTA